MIAQYIRDAFSAFAVGDAFGAGYEFRPVDWIWENFTLEKHHPSKWSRSQTPGRYTDDTQKSAAFIEALLLNQTPPEEELAFQYVRAVQQDMAQRMPHRTFEFMKGVADAQEYLERIDRNSCRNGAAMSAMVLGIDADVDVVVKNALTSAMMTHYTDNGMGSSLAVALTAHYVFHQYADTPEDLFSFVLPIVAEYAPASADYLQLIRDTGLRSPKEAIVYFGLCEKGVPCDGIITAGVIMNLVQQYWDDPIGALRGSVLIGGDTDSVASSVYGILVARNGFDDSVAPKLLAGLEEGEYGREYIEHLGKQWAQLAYR